jgi:hypothetical protein
MKLAEKVQEWLSHLQWNDELTLDEENQTSSVSFYYSIKNQSFKVWVETDEKRDVLEIYFYAPFNLRLVKSNAPKHWAIFLIETGVISMFLGVTEARYLDAYRNVLQLL